MAEYIERYAAITTLLAKLDECKHAEFLFGDEIDTIIRNIPAADVVEVCRCKDCKHRPSKPGKYDSGCNITFPDEVCPCHCIDTYYSWYPKDDWFCPNGECREEGGGE